MMIFPLFCFLFLFLFFQNHQRVTLLHSLIRYFLLKRFLSSSSGEHTGSHLHTLMFPHRTFSGADPRELLSVVEEGTLQEPCPGKR